MSRERAAHRPFDDGLSDEEDQRVKLSVSRGARERREMTNVCKTFALVALSYYGAPERLSRGDWR
jgi:hypothetical protein